MARSVFRGYNRVKFQSLKLGTTIFCQSLLLRDYLLHIEWDENVQSYELKPFKIFIKINGNRKIIQPHLRLNHTNQKPTLVWLKSAIDDEENQRKTIKFLKNFLESNDFNFSVLIADEIRKEPFYSNLKFLRRYLRSEITFSDTLLCQEFFSSVSEPVLGDLVQFLHKTSCKSGIDK